MPGPNQKNRLQNTSKSELGRNWFPTIVLTIGIILVSVSISGAASLRRSATHSESLLGVGLQSTKVAQWVHIRKLA